MEIIEKGKLPGERLYKGTCSNCNCRIRFREDEAERRTGRNSSFLEVKCPTRGCDVKIYVDTSLFGGSSGDM